VFAAAVVTGGGSVDEESTGWVDEDVAGWVNDPLVGWDNDWDRARACERSRASSLSDKPTGTVTSGVVEVVAIGGDVDEEAAD